MKEIETLVEEKTKESLDVSRLTREGERTELGAPRPLWRQQAGRAHASWEAPRQRHTPHGQPQDLSQRGSGLNLASVSLLTRQQDFRVGRALRFGFCERN